MMIRYVHEPYDVGSNLDDPLWRGRGHFYKLLLVSIVKGRQLDGKPATSAGDMTQWLDRQAHWDPYLADTRWDGLNHSLFFFTFLRKLSLYPGLLSLSLIISLNSYQQTTTTEDQHILIYPSWGSFLVAVRRQCIDVTGMINTKG